MTKYQEGYADGIDKAIEVLEKYKTTHVVLELIIRDLKKAKKNEISKKGY